MPPRSRQEGAARAQSIPTSGGGLGQDRRECSLAHPKRIAAQIVPVQLDQVEGIEEHAGIIPAISD